MIKISTVVPVLALLLYTSLSAITTAGAIIGPTEIVFWDSAASCNGYTLFGARGTSYLIDMRGRLVHKWAGAGQNPKLLAYNGHLLDASKSDPKGFVELDWSSNVVWSYTEARADYAPHHDFIRIYNKKLGKYTTIYIANKTVPADSALAHGANPANGPYTGAQMDALVEVDSSGTVVWEWWFFNHLIQDLDSTKKDYVGTGKTIASYPNRLNINLPGRPLQKDWLHCNSVDYNPYLGQIVTNCVQGEFYVIDHDNTFIANDPSGSIALAASSTGDFLYRFGDPARYSQGLPPSVLTDWTKTTTGNKQIGGAHNIQWIDTGLVGAGNFLIFNNGEYLLEQTPQSYIFEISPYLDSSLVNTGKYVNPPTASYIKWTAPDKNQMKSTKNLSKQVTWMYYSKNSINLYSTIGSSAQRLSNGNTLICAMCDGHLLEVTGGGTGNGGSLNGDPAIVWEYICPITNDGVRDSTNDEYPMYNSTFRAYRFNATFPAFTGKDMTPGQTIAGRTISGANQKFSPQRSAFVTAQVSSGSGSSTATIRFSNPDRNARVYLYSPNGRLVFQKKDIAQNRITMNTNGLPKGLYLGRIALKSGTACEFKLLISGH